MGIFQPRRQRCTNLPTIVAHLNDSKDLRTIVAKAFQVSRNGLVEQLLANGCKVMIVRKVRASHSPAHTDESFHTNLRTESHTKPTTSPEICYAIVNLRHTDTMRYEQLSTPPPLPLCRLFHQSGELYPEDWNEAFVDSSPQIDGVVAWIADRTPGVVADSSDGKGGRR